MFIEEYLRDLRRDRFTPRATAQYIRRVAQRVREDMVSEPGAVRSVWSICICRIPASASGSRKKWNPLETARIWMSSINFEY